MKRKTIRYTCPQRQQPAQQRFGVAMADGAVLRGGRALYAIRSSEAGYLAITVALIFSLIALFIAASLGTRTLIARFSRLEYVNKKISYALARSCDDVALLRMRGDINYAGSETLTVGTYTCAIFPVEQAPPNYVIKTKATVQRATTNLKFTVNAKLQHVSLEELTVLP